MTESISNLLTPSDVAEMLKISEQTVYKHRRRFYGFKPAGLGILRFRKEIINGIMEGQDPEALVLQFPISERFICGKRVQDKKRSSSGQGKKKRRAKKDSDINRHGLLDSL